MQCQFPRCKYTASNTFKGVELCISHHTAILEETADYNNRRNRKRSMKSERSFRKLYYTIAPLFKKPAGEEDG